MKRERITITEDRLSGLLRFSELKTQELRVKLINQLEGLFNHAAAMAQSRAVENREEWLRIAGYIAQVINSFSNSFDEVRLNEDMQRLRDLIERAKRRAGIA